MHDMIISSVAAVAMGHRKDLMLFDNRIIIGARRMVHCFSKVSTHLGFYQATVARIYQVCVNSGQILRHLKNG